jgi:hypothetical protein
VFIIQEGGIRLPFVVFDDNSPQSATLTAPLREGS